MATPAESPSAASRPKRHSLEGGFPPVAGKALLAVVTILAILLPFALDPISSLLSDIVIALSFAIFAQGLNVVVGFAGLLDLGYVAFFAIGAYTVGWLASGFFFDANAHVGVTGFLNKLPGVHLNFLIVLVAAMVLCALGGMLIGLPTLRLRGDYIAIVTLAFGEIIRVFAVNGDAINLPFTEQKLTAGRQGINPIDQVNLFGIQFGQLDLRPWYWLVLGLLVVVLFCVIRLRDSRLGRAWIALREDEVAAASMGVPLVRTKLAAYAVGAAIGGVAGAFQASYLSVVTADQFAFTFSIFILAIVILGGLGSVWGVLLGAILLSFINSYLIPDVLSDVPQKIGLDFQLSDLGFGIFGFLLVIVMVLRPEGLLPEKRRQIELTEGTGSDESVFEVRA